MRMILISIWGHFNENDSQTQQILLKNLYIENFNYFCEI